MTILSQSYDMIHTAPGGPWPSSTRFAAPPIAAVAEGSAPQAPARAQPSQTADEFIWVALGDQLQVEMIFKNDHLLMGDAYE